MAAPRSRNRGQLTRQERVSLTKTAARRAKEAIASGGEEDVEQLGTRVIGQHARNLHERQRHRQADARFHSRQVKRLEKKWVRKEVDLDWASYQRMKKAGVLPQSWQVPEEAFSDARRRPLRLKRKAVARTGWRTFKGQGYQDPNQLMTDAARATTRKLTQPLRRGVSAAARRARRGAGRAIHRGATHLIPPRLAQSKVWTHTQNTIRHVIHTGRTIAAVIGAVTTAVTTTLPAIGVTLGIVIALCSILPSFITGVGAEHQRRQDEEHARLAACSGPGSVTAEDVAKFLPSPRGTDISASLSEEQRATARAIVEEGQKAGIPPRGWAVALMTAMQESTMGANPVTKKPNSDVDVGVFQQRAKVGWYADGATVQENVRILNDIHYSARTFYLGHKVGVLSPSGAGSLGYQIPGLVNIDGWESMDLGQAAQRVQVSAFPDYYGKHEATVAALLPTLNPQGCTAAGTPGSSGLAGRDEYAAWYAAIPEGVRRKPHDPNGFAWRQCTSYAAFAVRTYSTYKDFNNWWRQDGSFGNANTWHLAARKAGLRVDQTPAVGAVAQRTSGDWGHVAYVVAVNDDGSFVINEYNHITSREFSSRTARIGNGSHDFNNFIHFEE